MGPTGTGVCLALVPRACAAAAPPTTPPCRWGMGSGTSQTALACSGRGVRRGGASLRVRVPIACLNSRMGLHTVAGEGKEGETVLRVLGYDPPSDTTLLQAVPVTGRTHQIRLHCWWLGHPVVGDGGCGWLPTSRQEGIAPQGGVCLHALRYAGDGWAYSVHPPPWAAPFLAPGLKVEPAPPEHCAAQAPTVTPATSE